MIAIRVTPAVEKVSFSNGVLNVFLACGKLNISRASRGFIGGQDLYSLVFELDFLNTNELGTASIPVKPVILANLIEAVIIPAVTP